MSRSDDLHALPPGLPVPVDDGGCAHLVGRPLPEVALASTAGRVVTPRELAAGTVVIYCYPRTGVPDHDPPGGLEIWDAIPGARGCTPQSCAYRDHHAELEALDATVYGLSTQTSAYQREMAERLHLPFEVLSDQALVFTRALSLPTFTVAGMELIRRLTLICREGRIVECFYPVFPPDADAPRVVEWLRRTKRPGLRETPAGGPPA